MALTANTSSEGTTQSQGIRTGSVRSEVSMAAPCRSSRYQSPSSLARVSAWWARNHSTAATPQSASAATEPTRALSVRAPRPSETAVRTAMAGRSRAR